jgi:NitT/TauT family transport system substrate-binding protein
MARKSSFNTRRRTVLKGLGGSVVATGLAGCSGAGNGGGGGGNGDGGGGGGGDGDLTEVGVVVPQFGLWDTTISFLVGQEEGFFEEEGLSVSRIDAEGGGGNVRTVVAGDAQIGLATGIAGLFAAYREGTNVRIVSNEINRSSDLFWYGLSDTVEEDWGVGSLDGVTVGFSSPGSSTNMVALTAAQGGGGEAVSVGGPPDANAAVEGGEVDLGWSVPPFFLEGVEAGDYTTVFRGGDVEPFNELSIRVNFVAGGLLEDDPETAEAYFAAHSRALEWAYDNLDQALGIWGEAIDNDNTEILRTAVEDGYPREALNLNDLVGLDAANQVAVDFDFIDDPLSDSELDELIDTSPIPGGS